MTTETTTTETGRQALAALGLDTRTAAGARALIRRAMTREGVQPEHASTPARAQAQAPLLAVWALQHPDKIALAVAAGFERAAQQWTEGNNSGDPRTLDLMDARCDETRRQVGLVCGLFGIERLDFPGLYPTYHRGTRTWYSGDELRALKGE
jgi:predicted cobalt transporter CbtA